MQESVCKSLCRTVKDNTQRLEVVQRVELGENVNVEDRIDFGWDKGFDGVQESRGEQRTFGKVNVFKRVYECPFRLFRPSITHVPKQLDDARPHPGVGLDILGNMNATMNDMDIFTEHIDDGVPLSAMPITHKGLDAMKKLPDERQKPDKRACCPVLGDSPGKTMKGPTIVAAHNRHEGKIEDVGTGRVVDVNMVNAESC